MQSEHAVESPSFLSAARPATRRQLLRWAGVIGAGGGALALLAACGGAAGVSVSTGSSAATETASSTAPATASSAASATASSAATAMSSIAPSSSAALATASSASSSAATAAASVASSASATGAPLAITAVPSQSAAGAGSSATAAAGVAAKAGTLIIGRGGDSVGLDPGQIQDGESTQVTTEIFDSLVRYDRKQPPLTIVPSLAEGWNISAR